MCFIPLLLLCCEERDQYSFGCCIGATLSGCLNSATYGVYFRTAGQRVDPNSNSTFMWRVKSSDDNVETLSVMKYTNWNPGQPDFYRGGQSCMKMWSAHSYAWDDGQCSTGLCSVCELDI